MRLKSKFLLHIFRNKKLIKVYFSYHQKYRLQGHRDLAKTLGLNSKRLQTSHVAARLNGYLVGLGGVKQFEEEVENLGLNQKQIDYVTKYLKENEGGSLYC
jgi:peptide-methionine (S)-S-oxide reductase